MSQVRSVMWIIDGHVLGSLLCFIGETIKLKTVINNATTLKVQPRATLYQTQIFMSGDRHRTLELVLGDSQYGNEVDPNDVVDDMIEIPVPARAQLTMKSSIITVKYFVHVTLDIPHNIDLHINLPIVLTNKCALRAAQLEPQTSFEHRVTINEKRTKRMSSKNHSTSSSNYDPDDWLVPPTTTTATWMHTKLYTQLCRY